MKIVIKPSEISGKIKLPPSKSVEHRAIIASAFCKDESFIKNVEFSNDIIATCNVLKNLGVDISISKYPNLNFCNDLDKIRNLGNVNLKICNRFFNKKDGHFKVLNNTLNCIESGSTLRFFIPIASIIGEDIIFTGSSVLGTRPLSPYYKIFDEQNLYYQNFNGGFPLKVNGKLKSGVFNIRGDISSQFITGLLFVLPILNGDSEINIINELQSRDYVDLTIDVLKKFSINIVNDDYKHFYISGNQTYKSNEYNVEGDFSQSAFWIVAGVLNGNIEIQNVNFNSLQGDKKIIDLVKKMGGNIVCFEDKVLAKKSNTYGIDIDASNIPDLVPALALLAALSKGRTRIFNAKRLRYKECDRLNAIALGINKLGGCIKQTEDGLIIDGKEFLNGGEVDNFNDHRMAMTFTIASLKSKNNIIMNNFEAVNKSYPQFYPQFTKNGGKVLF